VEIDGKLTGDKRHPANLGRLCSKGAALADTLDHEGKLLYPEIGGKRVTWDEALDRVAAGFSRVIAEHGPDAVAFYVSGQILTEDYYVANKLMKGFIGSANIDTNSRLCMASAVAAHKRAFGADAVPVCYEDIEAADLVVIAGSNLAWAHPVLYQRLAAEKKKRPAMRVVVIDPRRTATCDIADLHLAIEPGSDAHLFNGLLHHLRSVDALDLAYIEEHVEGYSTAFAAARESGSIPRVASACGINEPLVAEFFHLFTRTRKSVTIFSQGINQSSSGVDKGNAIINVHLATGRIGKPGMGPFSVTGQPNAMGGREVGGLANQLAAHMDFSDPANMDRVARFWDAKNIAQKPGLKALDMFQAIADKKIRAVWIMGTNPVVSMPDADRVRKALAGCEMVVVSDCVAHTDTTECADILLPACGWGEKDGTVTNSERRISRQRAFVQPSGEARPDWWIITEVAKRMGFSESFHYSKPSEIFREHARLSGFENEGHRAFDISAMGAMDDEQYDALQPVQWPVNAGAPNGTARLYSDGKFHTPTGRARMIAITPRGPMVHADADFPLVLNTGRMRDQWHTMTRTALVPRLNSHSVEPVVQVHAQDANQLANGSLACLTSRHGNMLARVEISEGQRRGSVFVPMHWNDVYARSARVDALVAPISDPISGQPESKHTPVRIEAYRPAWQGFVLSRSRLALPDASYCACTEGTDYWRHEIAGEQTPGNWRAWAEENLKCKGNWIEYLDAAMGRYRAACLADGKLEAVFFIAPDHHLPEREWLASLFKRLDPIDLPGLLAARAPRGNDAGRVVCACHNVGEKTILDAIRKEGLKSVEEVGLCLKAGTNCGSCVPEIRSLLARH
jgi:assimilatory nitrate reductase catalytic subunit